MIRKLLISGVLSGFLFGCTSSVNNGTEPTTMSDTTGEDTTTPNTKNMEHNAMNMEHKEDTTKNKKKTGKPASTATPNKTTTPTTKG